MSDEIRKMDIAEFRNLGYLQEVNRCFLHPLGLALEIVIDDDGTTRLGGIWDYRDDSEGIYFGDPLPADFAEKAERIDGLRAARVRARFDALGYFTQPVGIVQPVKDTLVLVCDRCQHSEPAEPRFPIGIESWQPDRLDDVWPTHCHEPMRLANTTDRDGNSLTEDHS